MRSPENQHHAKRYLKVTCTAEIGRHQVFAQELQGAQQKLNVSLLLDAAAEVDGREVGCQGVVMLWRGWDAADLRC